ncbi:hypothetical protein [Mesoplasma photuris]|uniref:hypothetical protein n=1 Tax=Mesoplasma photuris TaxID=217731 RepID=UPI0004E22C79|nr:hypothetical protein [Mesoplasma photuris]
MAKYGNEKEIWLLGNGFEINFNNELKNFNEKYFEWYERFFLLKVSNFIHQIQYQPFETLKYAKELNRIFNRISDKDEIHKICSNINDFFKQKMQESATRIEDIFMEISYEFDKDVDPEISIIISEILKLSFSIFLLEQKKEWEYNSDLFAEIIPPSIIFTTNYFRDQYVSFLKKWEEMFNPKIENYSPFSIHNSKEFITKIENLHGTIYFDSNNYLKNDIKINLNDKDIAFYARKFNNKETMKIFGVSFLNDKLLMEEIADSLDLKNIVFYYLDIESREQYRKIIIDKFKIRWNFIMPEKEDAMIFIHKNSDKEKYIYFKPVEEFDIYGCFNRNSNLRLW